MEKARINRDELINSFLVAFLIGVAVAAGVWKSNLLAWLAGGFLIFGFLKIRKDAGVVLICFVAFLFGVFRLIGELDLLREYKNYDGLVLAEVLSFPEIRGDRQTVVLGIKKIGEKLFEEVIPRLSADLEFFAEVIPGQNLELDGKLKTLTKNELQERDDWLRKKLNFRMDSVKYKVMSDGKISWLGYLFVWRKSLLGIVNKLFDQQTATMVAGVILGERGSIDKAILNDFKTTGLTHILAVSGFNITIIVNFVLLALMRFSKWWRLGLVFLVIMLFVILTGASASVIRAGVMGVLALLIRTSGRSAHILKVLLISGGLIVAFDPTVLNFDISFQLSFGATLSLVLFADWIEDYEFRPGWWKDLVVVVIWQTIAAQLIVLPIIFVNFGQVSLISPIANLLTAPLIPILMFLGIVTILLGNLWLGLGQVFGIAAGLLVKLLLLITSLLARMPLASWSFGEGQYWLAMIYWYALFRLFRRRKLVPSFG